MADEITLPSSERVARPLTRLGDDIPRLLVVGESQALVSSRFDRRECGRSSVVAWTVTIQTAHDSSSGSFSSINWW
jgi:hypothetical protein